MTKNAESLISALRQAQQAVSLAKVVRGSVNTALIEHVRSRMKANKLPGSVICRRLNWPPSKLTNFTHLNYILHDDELTALLKAIELPRAKNEALRKSRFS